MCPFDYTAFTVIGEGWDPVNRFNHTSWMSFVTQTDRPETVRNRRVIEFLVAFLCYHVVLDFLLVYGLLS